MNLVLQLYLGDGNMDEVAGHVRYQYKPTEKIRDRLWDFVYKVHKTNRDALAKRNQTDATLIQKQCYAGKLLEVGFHYWVLSQGYKVTKDVDIKIYSANNKDFSSDLEVERNGVEKKVSCKASLCERGGDLTDLNRNSLGVVEKQYSYVYQNSNNDGLGGKDKYKHTTYVFGNYYEPEDTIEVYAWVNADIVKDMFVLPFFKKFWKGELNQWGKVNENDIKYCIMQKSTNIDDGKRLFPCSVDELIERQKQNA